MASNMPADDDESTLVALTSDVGESSRCKVCRCMDQHCVLEGILLVSGTQSLY